MMLRRGIAVSRWGRFFADDDSLICPSSFGPACARTKVGSKLRYEGHGMVYGDYLWPFMACCNASGHPALNIPLVLGKEGLPLAVHIVGPYWSKPELINFAKQASQLTEGFVKPAGY